MGLSGMVNTTVYKSFLGYLSDRQVVLNSAQTQHYLNQCWLVIRRGLRHSPEHNFAGNSCNINNGNVCENCNFYIWSTSTRDQWIEPLHASITAGHRAYGNMLLYHSYCHVAPRGKLTSIVGIFCGHYSCFPQWVIGLLCNGVWFGHHMKPM